MRGRDSSRGFTVVELLVVVSIIAVLASILLPVMSGVIRNERAMVCQANERILAAAMFQYASTFDGVLSCPSVIGEEDHLACWDVPNGGTADFTHGTLWPYISSSVATRQKIVKCPSDNNECLPRAGSTTYPPGNFSYSFNANIRWSWFNASAVSFPVALSLRQVRNPAMHGMVFEEFAPNDGLCCGPGDSDDYFTGRHGPYGTSDARAAYYDPYWINSGKGNVAYFDGHVEMIPTSEFQNNVKQIFSPID